MSAEPTRDSRSEPTEAARVQPTAETAAAPPPPPPAAKPDQAGQLAGFAGVGFGAASLLMPYFVAVFMVPMAFICGVFAFVRGRKGLGVTALLLATIGLFSVLATSQQISNITKNPFGSGASTSAGSASVVTMAEYQQISEGMTYEEVVAIIGSAGQELSSSNAAGYSTVMYSWSNDNGSNMNAMFQNGRLINKAQMGLP